MTYKEALARAKAKGAKAAANPAATLADNPFDEFDMRSDAWMEGFTVAAIKGAKA